jgi:hypothetical protein
MKILPYIVALLLVAGALFGAYHHGVSVTNETWQSQWNARDTRDAQAKAENEAAARVREQAYQQSINKAVQDGQRTIDQATADALLLALLLTACAGRQTLLPLDSQPVKPAAIPALPLQGRQLPVTPLCSPTCSSALTSERVIWQQLLTKPEPGPDLRAGFR